MKTLEQPTLPAIAVQLMLFQEASLASLSALLEKEKEQMMTATSGRKCYEQYEKLSRHGLSLRMFAGCLAKSEAWYSSVCALRWKVRGTKFNRLLFQLAPLARRTEGIEFGLLPMLLKTPSAMDARSENLKKSKQSWGNSGTLAQEVQTGFIYNRRLLPTPHASDGERGGQVVSGMNITRPSGQTFMALLNDLAKSKLLPTPQATDHKRGTKSEHQQSISRTVGLTGSQLNPLFVAEMMGFPVSWTVLPFLRGAESL